MFSYFLFPTTVKLGFNFYWFLFSIQQKIHEILSKEFNELPVKKLDKILKIHLELNNQYEKQLKMY